MASAKVRNSLNIVLKSVDLTLKPLGRPQIILVDVITQMGVFWGKSTYSSSIMETKRLAGAEDGDRDSRFILQVLFSTHSSHKTCLEC